MKYDHFWQIIAMTGLPEAYLTYARLKEEENRREEERARRLSK